MPCSTAFFLATNKGCEVVSLNCSLLNYIWKHGDTYAHPETEKGTDGTIQPTSLGYKKGRGLHEDAPLSIYSTGFFFSGAIVSGSQIGSIGGSELAFCSPI
jgi:hypothetical protein